MGEAMISPDEFLHRCEQVKEQFTQQGRERQQLTRELAALCVLTGARAEFLYDHNAQLTGLRVSDPGGDLVTSGPVDKVLAELVAVARSMHRRPRDSRTTTQPPGRLVAGKTVPEPPRLDLVGTDQTGLEPTALGRAGSWTPPASCWTWSGCIKWRRGALRVRKRPTATTEALMKAAGEPTGAGRA
jgi:hypothetical protein